MPRMLSNFEWSQFMTDNASLIQSMSPEQSKVVSWNGESVLVYIGPNPIEQNGNLYPDVYLTDVSDTSQIQAISTPGYGTTPAQTMLDTLPQSVIDALKDDASTVGVLVNSAGQAIAAGASGVASAVSLPIIAALVILALIYLPRPR